MKLTHLKHNQIDFERWDAALANSHQPIIYANSWFLNIVSPNWEALVNNDYSAIIPLPIKKIGGVKLIIQPPFCQQLGLYINNNKLSEHGCFQLNKLPFATIVLQSNTPLFKKGSYFSERSNFVLPLRKDFKQLKQDFKQNTKRNIKKAKSYNQTVEKTTCVDTFMHFFQQHPPYEMSQKNRDLLKQIIETSLIKKAGTIWMVKDASNNILCMAFFLEAHHRLTYLSGLSSPNGLEKKSMFLLINQLIKEEANSNKIVDFEGGNIEGIARFYKGFGAIEDNYINYQHPFLKHLVTARRWIKGARKAKNR